MDTIINRIVELSGPLPDEGAFRRYLGRLSERELKQKAADLLLDLDRVKKPPARVWRAEEVRPARQLVSP